MIFSKGRAIGLICTIATLLSAIVVVFRMTSGESLEQLTGFISFPIILLLLVLYGVHFLSEPIRWKVYSRLSGPDADHRKTGFFRIFACFNITALLSFSLPFKLGLPIRLFLLSHFLALKKPTVIKFMATDGVFNLFSWSLLAMVTILCVPDLSSFYARYVNSLYLLIAGLGILVVLGILIRWKGRLLLQALRSIPPGSVALVIATLLVDILFYGVRHVVMADVLGLSIPSGTVFIVGIIAMFTGIVSTLPMGLGAYDATLVALLSLYGVEVELGLVLALCNRLAMIFTSVVFGLPSVIVMVKKDPEFARS